MAPLWRLPSSAMIFFTLTTTTTLAATKAVTDPSFLSQVKQSEVSYGCFFREIGRAHV